MDLLCPTPASAFVDTCEAVLEYGDRFEPRGMSTLELLNVTLRIMDPRSFPFDVEGRELNHMIAALETVQLLGQTPADALTRKRVKAVAAFQDYGISYGNYGARLRGQLTNICKELHEDGDSRRAVATIYHGPSDLRQGTRDVPCTLSLQFFVRDGALQTRVSMRSNDAWFGLPYDLHQFCALHCAMAEVLDVAPGVYTHTVGSMHLYQQHWQAANDLGEAFFASHDEFFRLGSHDVLDRLSEMTTACQDIMIGTHEPRTRFENWLVEEVG